MINLYLFELFNVLAPYINDGYEGVELSENEDGLSLDISVFDESESINIASIYDIASPAHPKSCKITPNSLFPVIFTVNELETIMNAIENVMPIIKADMESPETSQADRKHLSDIIYKMKNIQDKILSAHDRYFQ